MGIVKPKMGVTGGRMKDHFGVSDRLRKLRGKESQVEFAKKIGVPLRTYIRYEKGERIPPKSVLGKIAQSGIIPVDWLTKGTFGMWEFFEDAKRQKKTHAEVSEVMAMEFLRYVKKFPKEFDRFERILREGNWDKIDALRSVLRALDPERKGLSKTVNFDE
jgi:transcriptional regulator with XRE-family HTH domain